MKVASLVKELRGKLPIAKLQQLNEELDDGEDRKVIISDILLVLTNCDEILDLLVDESRPLSEVVVIFNVLSHIIMMIASDLNEFMNVGLHIVRRLLISQSHQIHRLLSPTNTSENIQTVLKLVTGMVVLSPIGAREVLAAISWTRVQWSVIINRRDPKVLRDVRSWCIYIFLAMLNSTDGFVVQQFVAIKGVLTVLFPGLMWDPCERIINVIRTLHTKVLLNAAVTKTTKVHLFTAYTVKPLMDLYKWEDPLGGKQETGKEGDAPEEMEDRVSTAQARKDRVTIELQSLLITLCSSHRHGVIFRQRVGLVVPLQGGEEGSAGRVGGGWMRRSNNMHVFRIISVVATPWETAQGRELVCSTLASCPDLVEVYLATVKEALVPKPTTAFVSLLKMLGDIIAGTEPWKKEVNNAKSLMFMLIPLPLTASFFRALLHSMYAPVRHAGMGLVLRVLQKMQETLNHLAECGSGGGNDLERRLVELVMHVFGGVEGLVDGWQYIIGKTPQMPDGKEEEIVPETCAKVSPLEALGIVAKAFNVCKQICRTMPGWECVTPVEMMSTLQEPLVRGGIRSSEERVALMELQALVLSLMECQCDPLNMEGLTGSDLDSNVFYQLIKIHMECSVVDETISKSLASLKILCCDIGSRTLAKYGLLVTAECQLDMWLRHVGGNEKLAVFLTEVIQKAVSSLSVYMDQLVEVSTQFSCQSGHDVHTFASWLELNLKDPIEDNEDVCGTRATLPFSRLILSAMDLLLESNNREFIDYFSRVVSDELLLLPEPRILISLLLTKRSLISKNLNWYLQCVMGQVGEEHAKQSLKLLTESYQDRLKVLFIVGGDAEINWLLDVERLKQVISDGDLFLVVKQLLMYLYLGLKSNLKLQRMEEYAQVLKFILATLEIDDSETANYSCFLGLVLAHPVVLELYHPYELRKNLFSLNDFVWELVASLFTKYPAKYKLAKAYWQKTMLKLRSIEKLGKLDFWQPLSVFIDGDKQSCFVFTFEEIEEIFCLCLRASKISGSIIKATRRLMELIQIYASPKRCLQLVTQQLMLEKWLECVEKETIEDDNENEMDDLIVLLEKLLVIVVSVEFVASLSADKLKALLNCHIQCPSLCLHFATLHLPHGILISRHFKKNGLTLPEQAEVLANILDREDCQKWAVKALEKSAGKLVSVLDGIMDFEDMIPWKMQALIGLELACLHWNFIDIATLASMCQKLYDTVVMNNKLIPGDIVVALSPLFLVVSESKDDDTLPNSGAACCLLLVAMTCLKDHYKIAGTATSELLVLTEVIENCVKLVSGKQLRKGLSGSALWNAFVNQILRKSFDDITNGPIILRMFGSVCDLVFTGKDLRGEGMLGMEAVYQRILAHSNYTELMLNTDPKWDVLKECVVNIQQVLVDRSVGAVCVVSHVPLLLGAYGASMSAADQRILKLLYTYEQTGHMSSISPIIWGERAVTHYGILSAGPHLGIYKEPKMEDVLSILDVDKLKLSCLKFDQHISLEPTVIWGNNGDIYDLRFLLPLFIRLSTSDHLNELKFAACGAPAVAFAALGSHQRGMWGAGALLLRQLVLWMEESRHQRFKLQWIWLVGVVSFSLNGVQSRLSSIIVNFLVHCVFMFDTPGHPMYRPIINYLFLKPALNLTQIPEFYRLYSSDDVVHHSDHRMFLLKMLSMGICENNDWALAQKLYAGKLVMALLLAPTADTAMKIVVLDVLKSMVSVSSAAKELVCRNNLLTILPLVVANGVGEEEVNRGVLKGVVGVLGALWSTWMEGGRGKGRGGVMRKVVEAREIVGGKRKIMEGEETESEKPKKKQKGNDKTEISEKKEESTMFHEPVSHRARKSFLAVSIHEFLSCLLLLTPRMVTFLPAGSLTVFLTLLGKCVLYMERIHDRCSLEEQMFCRITLNPMAVKKQVELQVPWMILLERFRRYCSDGDEVQLLGNEVTQKLRQEWRREPLMKLVEKNLDNRTNSDVPGVMKAVRKLMQVVGRQNS